MYLIHCLHRYLREIKVGRKELIVMNYLTIFLLATCLQLSAGVYAQKVTLSGENISLKYVFSEIKKQTGYTFVYREVLLQRAGKVNINVRNASIQQVLDICFRNQPLSYSIINNNIVVVKEAAVVAPPAVVAAEKPVMAKAPPIKITGVILAENGTPLQNANVSEKGKLNSVITKTDGTFTMMVEGPQAVLVISYVGFDDKLVPVGDQTELIIKLTTTQSPMEEQVVVGYGTSKKATVTGALEPVANKTFDSRAVTNPALALQGTTPGLVITRTSSRPGNEDLVMQIRGATSINGGSPLIVIDGVPVASQNAFFTMNPDDIESVNVLKDGMAAIFGSRAANGVILITTKRGKGKTRIDYNFNARINTIGIKTPAPNMQQYATMWIDANKEEIKPNYWGWASLDNLQKMQKGQEGIYHTDNWGDVFIGNANRFDELFATRVSQQHTLGISGSTDKTAYRLSAGYADNQGPLATSYDGRKQYNLRLNYDYKLTEKVKLQTGVTYQKDITSGPSSGLRMDLIAYDPPFFPAKNPYGEWYANFNTAGNRNSTAATTDGGRDIKANDLVRVDIKGTAELYKGLEAEATASIQSNQLRLDNYQLTVPMYQWDGTPAEEKINPESNIRAESDQTLYQNYSAILRYTKTFGGHRIIAMGGINAEKSSFKGLYAYRTNIESNGVYDLNVAPKDYVEGNGGRNEWGLYSYIGRLNYSFRGKYLVEMLGRRDGSSRFAPGYKWSNFYDVSAGWVLTNENFIRDLNLYLLNYLKIRGGYGVMGNNVNIDLYDYISNVVIGNSIFGSTPAIQSAASLARNGLTSPDRTWEQVKMANIGVDLVMLNNRLNGRFDYYKKKNDGMLINVVYPGVLGGDAPQTNSGVLEVKGWEAMLGWHDKIGKDFSYNVSVNVSDSRNKLVAYDGAILPTPGLNQAVIGRPLNSWYMYKTRGFLADQKTVDLFYDKYTAIAQGNIPARTDDQVLRPGDTRKMDVNKDGVIDQNDVSFKGDAAPHYTFGLTLGASWKNIDFTAFLQGVGQQYVERDGWLAYPFVTLWSNLNPSFIGKTWTAENPGAKYPRLTIDADRSKWNYLHNDFMLQNNRYVRLKTLIIGYTLPQTLSARAHLEKVRVYFSGNDLWEWSSIKDGFDPEQGANSVLNGYPFMRTWSFGVNVGL
ncbi:SusC/RagA family TonB-linked outer membrane protein [Niastella koreensis]|uniref:TonB-dependent receptor plug n=2 Tax=Niastella koreensis TaxID=354356 RepID=G8T7R9_NIAKG|nr:TonB-dependent receptor [Niastella koreensis]AEW03363.1 TonB-dependent receptor plug [Niastella koreensis GR20-10]OQP55646.1 SusC/RagA family TonB-linked outer membrane protein [Niastella koreensis]